jgi:5-methylcytosine-specific restriction endonuclease McrA
MLPDVPMNHVLTNQISYEMRSKPVSEILNLYERGLLDLEPGFQRKSVWRIGDRQKLIESILRCYPLPAIFLYKRAEGGSVAYDVIDGKQRLETIFMFMGAIRGRFEIKHALNPDDANGCDWTLLKRRKMQHLITDYELSVIHVDGSFSDIIDLFVKINSTGKALTRQEKTHAKFFSSPFLKEADKVARKFMGYFKEAGVLSDTQISRMKHVELVSELMLSLHKGDVLNKKAALDRVMSSETMDGRSIQKASRLTVSTLNRLKKMFPKLRQTRFHQLADFYTLAVLIGRLESEGLVLTDPKRNQLTWDLLVSFSNRIDELREKQRRVQSIDSKHELYREYLLTVQQGTDEVNQRRQREKILRQLLVSLFSLKDSQRGFTPEQRRLLWNSAATNQCGVCRKKLTWANFTIDHIDPYSRGGKSALENAAIVCQPCNSAMGAKQRRQGVKAKK